MSIVFTIIAILTNTLPRWLIHSEGLPAKTAAALSQSFCTWQAFSFVCMAIACKLYKCTTREKVWLEYCGVLAVNNWIDEVRGQAAQIDGIEIIFAASATAWLIYRLCQTDKHSTKKL